MPKPSATMHAANGRKAGAASGRVQPAPAGLSHFILYVSDQEKSTQFYTQVLAQEPRLHVPGMTEFALPGGAVLGLMPEKNICALLGPQLPDPQLARGVPRAELYLLVQEPHDYHSRALSAGARELSPPLPRSWGHTAGYSLDLDSHVLAFASAPVVPRNLP